MSLIDTHAHVDASGGIRALAPTKPGEEPTQVVAVTNLPRHYQRLRDTHSDRVQWALGLHPAQPHPPSALHEFLALLPHCDAIGEVGLDGAPATSPLSPSMARQREELASILSHPRAAQKTVSLHSRRAVPAVIEHLREAAIPGAILHWFTGSPGQARKAADTGAYFSINHRMARKQDLLAALPRDRVLLETDAPHTSKTIRPGDLTAALQGIADHWGADLDTTSDQIMSNQEHLARGLAPSDPSLR